MSTCLRLIYALGLGNHVHFTFIFFVELFLKSVFWLGIQGPIEYE